jgi:hypothetical protein
MKATLPGKIYRYFDKFFLSRNPSLERQFKLFNLEGGSLSSIYENLDDKVLSNCRITTSRDLGKMWGETFDERIANNISFDEFPNYFKYAEAIKNKSNYFLKTQGNFKMPISVKNLANLATSVDIKNGVIQQELQYLLVPNQLGFYPVESHMTLIDSHYEDLFDEREYALNKVEVEPSQLEAGKAYWLSSKYKFRLTPIFYLGLTKEGRGEYFILNRPVEESYLGLCDKIKVGSSLPRGCIKHIDTTESYVGAHNHYFVPESDIKFYDLI